MRGEIQVLYPDKAPETRTYIGKPLPDGTIEELVGGYFAVVPGWDHAPLLDGKVRPCVVYANEEGMHLKLLTNLWASAMWQFVVRAKGGKPSPQNLLYGPVVIITGDDEFMEAL